MSPVDIFDTEFFMHCNHIENGRDVCALPNDHKGDHKTYEQIKIEKLEARVVELEALCEGLNTGDWSGEIPNALRLNEHGKMEESEILPSVDRPSTKSWIENMNKKNEDDK